MDICDNDGATSLLFFGLILLLFFERALFDDIDEYSSNYGRSKNNSYDDIGLHISEIIIKSKRQL